MCVCLCVFVWNSRHCHKEQRSTGEQVTDHLLTLSHRKKNYILKIFFTFVKPIYIGPLQCYHGYGNLSLDPSHSIYPKSIKSSPWTSSPPCPRLDQLSISSLTSLPKSSCSLLKSSKHIADHSPMGGAGALIGTTLAFLFGQSLGDLLQAVLVEMVGVRSIGPELGPGTATAAGAASEGSVEGCLLW